MGKEPIFVGDLKRYTNCKIKLQNWWQMINELCYSKLTNLDRIAKLKQRNELQNRNNEGSYKNWKIFPLQQSFEILALVLKSSSRHKLPKMLRVKSRIFSLGFLTKRNRYLRPLFCLNSWAPVGVFSTLYRISWSPLKTTEEEVDSNCFKMWGTLRASWDDISLFKYEHLIQIVKKIFGHP